MINDQIIKDWKATGYSTTHPLYNSIINDLYPLVRAYATKLGYASCRVDEIDDVAQQVIVICSEYIKRWNPEKATFWVYINMTIYNKTITAFRKSKYVELVRTSLESKSKDDISYLDTLSDKHAHSPDILEMDEKLQAFRKMEKELIPYLSDTQLLAYSIYVLKVCGGTYDEYKCDTMTYKNLNNAIRCTKMILKALLGGKKVRISKDYSYGSKFDPRVEYMPYDTTIPGTSSLIKCGKHLGNRGEYIRSKRVGSTIRYRDEDKVMV